MRAVRIYFQHGWAFTSSVWERLALRVKSNIDADIELHFGERGYFGSMMPLELTIEASADCTNVIVAHSLGLHLIPIEIIRQAHLLISLGGFLSFHTAETALITRRIIRRMQQKLAVSPRSVVNDFYGNCLRRQDGTAFADSAMPNVPEQIDIAALSRDLSILDESVIEPSLFQHLKKVMIIHGRDDTVVPAEQSHRLQSALRGADLRIIDGGTHALPITEVNAVARFLTDMVGLYERVPAR